jgi:anti-anti-sigma regulatory factor
VLWSVLDEHFTYQLVLDLEEADCLDETSVKQLMTLAQWVVAQHGTIRLCGLSDHDRNVLRRCGVASCLPAYADIGEAIFAGHPPRQPR